MLLSQSATVDIQQTNSAMSLERGRAQLLVLVGRSLGRGRSRGRAIAYAVLATRRRINSDSIAPKVIRGCV